MAVPAAQSALQPSEVNAAGQLNQHEMSLAEFVSPQPLASAAVLSQLDALPHMPLPVPRCLLCGPRRSGKTTLLMHYALQLARRGRSSVLLCDRAALDAAPPLLPQDVTSGDVALQDVNIKYVGDLHDLRAYGACLHLLQQLPDVVLVDGLSRLLDNARLNDKRTRDAELTRTLAYLVDGLEQQGRRTGRMPLLLVADDSPEDGQSQHHHLLDRWFPLALAVSGSSSGGTPLSLAVSPQSRQCVSPEAARAAVAFHLTPVVLKVESVTL